MSKREHALKQYYIGGTILSIIECRCGWSVKCVNKKQGMEKLRIHVSEKSIGQKDDN